MKKILIASILLSSSLLVACSNDENDKNKKENENNVATFDGGNISYDEFYKQLSHDYGTETIQKLALNKILEEKYPKEFKAAEDKYKKFKEEHKENLERYIKSGNFIDEEDFKNDFISNQMQTVLLVDKIKPTEEQLANEKVKFKQPVQVNAIYTSSKYNADKAYEKLEYGEPFTKVAEEFSEDLSNFAYGDRGLITYDDANHDPVIFETAHKLQVGEYSIPKKGNRSGYYIVSPVKFSTLDENTINKTIRENVVYNSVSLAKINELYINLLKEYNVQSEDKELNDSLHNFEYGKGSQITAEH